MVSHDVFVMQVFEDVPAARGCQRRWTGWREDTYTSDTMSFLSRSDMRSNLSSLRANIWKTMYFRRHKQTAENARAHHAVGFPPHFADDTKRACANNIKRLVQTEKRRHGGSLSTPVETKEVVGDVVGSRTACVCRRRSPFATIHVTVCTDASDGTWAVSMALSEPSPGKSLCSYVFCVRQIGGLLDVCRRCVGGRPGCSPLRAPFSASRAGGAGTRCKGGSMWLSTSSACARQARRGPLRAASDAVDAARRGIAQAGGHLAGWPDTV